ADCNYPLGAASGSLVCNRQAGRCEPCDVPPATPYPLSTGALKDCNPGHSCQIPGGGVASWCGIPPIGGFNLHPSVDGGLDRQITLPINQVSLDGTVTDDGLPNPPGLTTILRTTGIFTIDWTKQSGPGIVTFGDAQSVDTIATFSQAGDYILRLTADDSQDTFYDELTVRVLCATNSQCTYPTQVCVSGTCERCTTNSQCTAPDQCMNGICAPRQACTGTTCANGYVCSNGFCTPCGGSVSCPSGTCNAATGQCGSTNAICGNLLLEPPVEQCERPTDCTPRPGHTSQCLSCACNYVPQGVMCGNGYKELGEQCETAGQCPFAQGFTIACTSCRCEYTPLIPGAVCGNGVLESPPEQCEGNNFNHCSRYYLRGGVCHSCRCYYDPNAWGNGNTNDPTCEDPPCASGPTCTRVGGTTCSNNIDCANYGTYGGYCGPDNCCNPYTPNGSSGTAQTNNPR
ncbi:MAG: hypothetical protein Q8L34_01795, partial [Candidatus Woesearchaeota archaeon]|nr:hypothetical protein [Candidatus Woesearchaeota archaeon]